MKEPDFEKSIEKLEKIVEALEEGDLSLDESLKKYEEGMKLAEICRNKLDGAKKMVKLLIKKDKDLYEQKPFDGAEE